MKSNFISLCSIILILEGITNCLGQNIYTGLTGGYVRMLAPENYTRKIKQDGLGLNNGYEIGSKLRLNFKDSHFGLALQANYARFSGCGTSDHVAPPWS